MNKLIKEYLEAKKATWSPSTLRSESSRLHSIAGFIDFINPSDTYQKLKVAGYSEYSIKTTMIRINKLFDWLLKNKYVSSNPYGAWLREHNYLFRNAYKKKELNVNFYEALERINSIEDLDVRSTALFLLHSGLRVHELDKLDYKDNGHLYVIGKGNKYRRVFAKPPVAKVKRAALRRELKKIGLTPHDLRRLFATRLLRKQIPIHDVAKATGHSSIETLMKYLQTDSDDKLQEAVEEALYV